MSPNSKKVRSEYFRIYPSETDVPSASELAETTKALDMSQDRIADLEQQLFEVGATVNAGNHVPPHTRVLQFSLNPVRQDVDLKKEVFERLSQENNALLQRLREVEEGLSVPGDARTVPRESWENLQMAKEDMQKLVAEKEKRLLRLKQVNIYQPHPTPCARVTHN